MREFTKSMVSYSWAMTLFGAQQILNVFQPAKAAESFDSVTKATEEEFADALKATFHAGDELQKGFVDVTFGALTLGMLDGSGATSPSGMAQQTGEAFRQGGRVVTKAVDAISRTVQGATSAAGGGAPGSTGWGPMPSTARDRSGSAPNGAAPGSRAAPTGSSSGARTAPASGAPSGSQQGWGPMPGDKP